MKTKLFLAAILALFFISCQKEMSFEGGGTIGSAEFTYDGAPAACTLPVISGTYMAGINLSASNTVTLPVTVTKTGTYAVSTASANGISFSGTGTFTSLGSHTIVLTGSGKPVTDGLYSFVPGVTGCSFTITVAAAAPPAVFTYANTAGICTGPVVSGTYKAGTPLTAANTIVLSVTVTTAGSYSVSTNTANGVTFSGSGLLALGAQTITLTSTNTPSAAGSFDYTPTGGCSFPIVYTPSTGGGGGSGTNFLKCKIDGTLVNFNTNLQGIGVTVAGFPATFTVQGKISDNSGPEEFWVAVQNPGAVNTGLYPNVTFTTILDRGCIVSYYPTGFPNIYFGVSVLTSNDFSVTITSLTANRIEGTFSGTLWDQNGTSFTVKKTIDSGSFSVGF
ncbi:hypothetical protein [Ferruginibacter sp.]